MINIKSQEMLNFVEGIGDNCAYNFFFLFLMKNVMSIISLLCFSSWFSCFVLIKFFVFLLKKKKKNST